MLHGAKNWQCVEDIKTSYPDRYGWQANPTCLLRMLRKNAKNVSSHDKASDWPTTLPNVNSRCIQPNRKGFLADP